MSFAAVSDPHIQTEVERLSSKITIDESIRRLDPLEAGAQMHALMTDLYPICRSITGEGLRTTLRRIGAWAPIEVHEVPSGTPVYDWTVPREWNIREAYVKDPAGRKIVDFKDHSLHVVSYSVPIKKKLPLNELKEHLFTIPEHPDWIPYRTSYYHESWGFCIDHATFSQLPDGDYEVYIDASLEDGHLSYGEYYLPGEIRDEVLISCTTCHPSMCNDNLSGVVLASYLARSLSQLQLRYSYRFLFLPGSIGPIAWLCLNEEKARRISHGLVVVCVGDPGPTTYKKSRRGNAEVDRAMLHVLQHSGEPFHIREFSPYGYEERQYCSPGFNLPVGCLMRTPHGEFPEYHTSADNLDFVKPQHLGNSLEKCLQTLAVLEGNRRYLNQSPYCEPQLGKRGLYKAMGGQQDVMEAQMALLWVLNLSDGEHSLLEVSERSGLSFSVVKRAAGQLVSHGLLKEAAEQARP